MVETKILIKKLGLYTKKNWFTFFAVGAYIFFTFYYMGQAFTQCQDSVYGFGDSTAGPIWKNSLEPKQPLLGGYEDFTNYPFGETLYSPVGFAALVQSVVMSVSSEVVGPVCAYNLYNIAGYLLTSIIVFAFVRYLLKSRWIALLSGYAIAFTPYVQSKVGGHPNYGFAGILVSVLWALLHFLRYPSIKHGAILAALLALCAYLDPYFILLAITIVIPVMTVWLFMHAKTIYASIRTHRTNAWNEFSGPIKSVIFAFGVFLLLISPLIIVRIKDANLIESSVGSVRGNVVAAAMLCSNKPLDYLLPDPRNVHLVDMFGQKYIDSNIENRNWCGFGESRVSLSLTLLTVILVGALLLIYKTVKGRSDKVVLPVAYPAKVVIGSVIGIGLFAFLLGLPPQMHGLTMLSGIILKVTEMWRIFAREYLVVNISIVLTAAIALWYLSNGTILRNRRSIIAILYGLIFLGVVSEYQINPPFNPPVFSYSKDIPQVYREIASSSDIRAIAEYPIDRMGIEHDSTVYYLTMQAVHGKRILNSAAMVDKQEKLHVALKDLTDPQTLPVLRALGIRHVVVHGEKPEVLLRHIPGVRILNKSNPVIYALTMVRKDDDRDIILVELPEGPKATSALVIDQGHAVNLGLIQSPLNIEYEALQSTQMKVVEISGVRSTAPAIQCFDVKMSAPNDKARLEVLVNGLSAKVVTLGGSYQSIRVVAGVGDTITLQNAKGYNMRIDNLGCR